MPKCTRCGGSVISIGDGEVRCIMCGQVLNTSPVVMPLTRPQLPKGPDYAPR